MSELTQKAATAQVERGKPTLRDLVQNQGPQIEVQLGGVLNSGAFVRAAVSEIQKSTDLQEATPTSVLGSVMLAAQLKLEIGAALGHFYLTTRRHKGVMECVPIVGYQGLIELAYRSGQISKIETFLVRDGDAFDFWADSRGGLQYTWRPSSLDSSAPWTGVVASASRTTGGDPIWAYLTREKVIGRRPSNWERGPWKSHEEEMARKTAVRELAPYLPKSTEFATAVAVQRQVEEQGATVSARAGVDEVIVLDGAGPTDA